MEESEYLLLSGIQHFCFCRRQWALIHLEQQWSENLRTAQGRIDHARCHDAAQQEKRGDQLILRGMRVVSHTLQLTGVCDVVEFHADPAGVPLQGRAGRWRPFPVEYKHGSAKENDADRLQLCAQAIALEEMLVCTIQRGALYYAESHRREIVEFTPELRAKTRATAGEMVRCFARGHTPKVRPDKHCNACSLKEICLPVLCRRADAERYICRHVTQAMEEAEPCESC